MGVRIVDQGMRIDNGVLNTTVFILSGVILAQEPLPPAKKESNRHMLALIGFEPILYGLPA